MLAIIILLFISEVIGEPPQRSIFDKFNQNDFKMKFEHLDIDYYDENIFKEFKIVTFKYNRTYTACNGTAEFKIDINNELEVIIQAYKFSSNEYRLFPLRFQVNACYALSKNLVGVADSRKCGNFLGCPFKKAKVMHVCNWSPDESKFPPFIPSGRYMLDIQLWYRSKEIAMIKAYDEVYRPIPIPK